MLVWGIPAVVVLAISVVLTARQLGGRTENVPRFSGSTEVLRMRSLLRSPKLSTRLSVAVVRDEAAASHYASRQTLDTIVRTWRDALVAAGAEVRVVRSSEISAARNARVIVVPSSPCLTVATREMIETAGTRGQGVIVTGLAGVKDAGCRQIGYGFLVALTGASRADTLRSRATVYVGIPAGGPLSADIPPGSRLELKPAVQVALRLAIRDGFYSDYELGPAPAGDEPLLDVAITRSTYKGARIVYWGFELHDAVDQSWNADVLALLVRNSIAWTGRATLASVEPWPNGRRAAAVLAQDVEDQFTNARYAKDSLAAIGAPGTFFLVSDVARRNKRLTRQLLRGGEVGSHSDNHRLLGGTPGERQEARLRDSQRDLTNILEEPVTGLRPPQEQFDAATMQAWLAAGGTYLFGANDARCVAPELLRIGTDTIVLVPRTTADDYALLEAGTLRSGEALDARLLAEFRRVRFHGGLYVLSYHSQLLSRREHVPSLARFARTLTADSSVWLATAGEVASWWKSRAVLESTARMRTASRVDVTLRNRGDKPVWGAVVRVDLPAARRGTRSNGELLSSEPGVARVHIPYIAARSQQAIWVSLGPVQTP